MGFGPRRSPRQAGRKQASPSPAVRDVSIFVTLYLSAKLILTINSLYNLKRKETKSAVAALHNGAKMVRKQDLLDGTVISDESSSSASDCDELPSPLPDTGVMYSFDATRTPTQGSQILNAALAKAVEKFEERETVKLVKNEYEVLDDEGESVIPSPIKVAKGKMRPMPVSTVADADEDYEFV